MPTPPSEMMRLTPASRKTQKTWREASARVTPERQPCMRTVSTCFSPTQKSRIEGLLPYGVSKYRLSSRIFTSSSGRLRGKSLESVPEPPTTA